MRRPAASLPEIGRDHLGVARDGGVVALGQHPAAREHGDGVAQALRPPRGCARPSGSSGSRASRSISATMRSTSSCAIPAVGSSSSIISGRARAWWRSPARACGRRQLRPPACRRTRSRPTSSSSSRARGLVDLSSTASERQKSKLPPRLRCSAMRTFSQRGQVREHGGDLEAADEPEPRHRGRLQAGDVAPLEAMVPRVGCRNLVSRLKQVVLPAPLGPISAWIVPAHPQVDAVDGDEAAELLGQPVGCQDGVGHPGCLPINIEVLICTRRRATQGHPERPGLSAKRVSAPGRRYPAPGRC